MHSNHPVILIVDKDVVLCSLLSSMLATKNAEIVCIHSIAGADNYMKRNFPPAVLFVDDILPDGLGLDYLNQIKAAIKKTKVILMSGNEENSMRDAAMASGCFAFLEKPFSYRDVSQLTDKALRKRKLFGFAINSLR